IEGAKKAGILDQFADRSTLVAGSMFENIPAGADAYIMKFIIHDWYDAECIKILSQCRKGIRPGGRLLVVDQVVPARNEPGISKLMDLEMLVLPGGMERTEKQFRELFAASGFQLERIIPMPAPQCIIEGVPVWYHGWRRRTKTSFEKLWNLRGRPSAGGRPLSLRWQSPPAPCWGAA